MYVCAYTHATYVCAASECLVPHHGQKKVWSPATESTEGSWEPNLSAPQEKQVLLTAEHSHQPPSCFPETFTKFPGWLNGDPTKALRKWDPRKSLCHCNLLKELWAPGTYLLSVLPGL